MRLLQLAASRVVCLLPAHSCRLGGGCREINKISGLKGTAVNVQSMVYGNVNDNSGTGVLFTRNPATGANELFGEFLINAQGEDVVAGGPASLAAGSLLTARPRCFGLCMQLII